MGMHNVAAAIMAGQVLVQGQERQWFAHSVFLLMANASLDPEAGKDGDPPRQFFMPQARVAEMLWGGEATPAREKKVKSAVETLRAAGLLRVLRRGGNGRTARYELLFEPDEIVVEAARYAAEYAVKKPKIAARSAKAKATIAAKRAAEAADEAALAEVAAIVDTVFLPQELGVVQGPPTRSSPREVGGVLGTPSGGVLDTKLGVPEGPPLRRRGKKRIRRLGEENNSPEVSTSPAAVGMTADNDDGANEDGNDDVRSHWHKVAKREAERAAARAPGGTGS